MYCIASDDEISSEQATSSSMRVHACLNNHFRCHVLSTCVKQCHQFLLVLRSLLPGRDFVANQTCHWQLDNRHHD